MTAQKHTFALFSPDIAQQPQVGSELRITDPQIITRIEKVLRVAVGDALILFHGTTVVHVQIKNYEKKYIICTVTQVRQAQALTPTINLWLPLIERDAFEHAVYMATVFGVHAIVPLVTQKTKRTTLTAHESNRLQRVMIAAAEQSKQFLLPDLQPVSTLPACIEHNKNNTGHLLLFDQAGTDTPSVTQDMQRTKSAVITALFGPEGDLTEQEKQLAHTIGAMPCKLTPTVLRTEHAVALGLGILRALL